VTTLRVHARVALARRAVHRRLRAAEKLVQQHVYVRSIDRQLARPGQVEVALVINCHYPISIPMYHKAGDAIDSL
jgi:hypothetical protein